MSNADLLNELNGLFRLTAIEADIARSRAARPGTIPYGRSCSRTPATPTSAAWLSGGPSTTSGVSPMHWEWRWIGCSPSRGRRFSTRPCRWRRRSWRTCRWSTSFAIGRPSPVSSPRRRVSGRSFEHSRRWRLRTRLPSSGSRRDWVRSLWMPRRHCNPRRCRRLQPSASAWRRFLRVARRLGDQSQHRCRRPHRRPCRRATGSDARDG